MRYAVPVSDGPFSGSVAEKFSPAPIAQVLGTSIEKAQDGPNYSYIWITALVA